MPYSTTHRGIDFTLHPTKDGSIDVIIMAAMVPSGLKKAIINSITLIEDVDKVQTIYATPPEIPPRKSDKRYQLTPGGPNGLWGLWKCYDRATDTTGYGDSARAAYDDCVLELEMNTSDIHK